MFSPNQQMAVHANMLSVQVPSPINYVGQNDSSSYVAMDGVPNSAFSQAESLVSSSKKLEDELQFLGQNIKHHEDNIKYLRTHISSLDDQIIDMQVSLGNHHSSSGPMTEDDRSQLKHNGTQADLVSSNDVLGVVATLGKVNDDNLSRLLSMYIGRDIMLSLVCMTYDGVKSLETCDKESFLSISSGLNGLEASIGRTMDGRFNVICLEHLRPYVGDFVPDDPQKRLSIVKPKLPNGESLPGFLGFAVNMIHITDRHWLRETLFYNLFSKLQVYRTRAHMLQALPCISDGAISLDGGIIKSNGVFVFGTREETNVRFAVSSCVPENAVKVEKEMNELKWKKETTAEELQREEAILIHFKYTFQVKKQEFVRFMAVAQSSPYAMQYPVQATPRRSTPR